MRRKPLEWHTHAVTTFADAQLYDLPQWRHVYSGKVRDLYEPASGDDSSVLVVASDRISAYDHVLSTTIPGKGAVLTRLSLWWFDQLADIVPSHVLRDQMPPRRIAERSMVCRKLTMFPVECVVRGYLSGSGLADYRETGAVCGVELPTGLVDGSRLPEPIFTPARKAALGSHDENIDFATVSTMVGRDVATRLRDLSISIYSTAEKIARGCGIILADTKFEFGVDPATGEITLGDEVLTPDSSRFWDAEQWQPGMAQPSFDKQYVRDWLTSPESGWDKDSDTPPPALPETVVAATRKRYVEAFERITGETF